MANNVNGREKTYLVKLLWLGQETEKARLYYLAEPGKLPPPGSLWVPKSVCKSTLKFAKQPGERYRRCQVEIEDWWWRQWEETQKPAGTQERLGL